jgi:hypothetical protein
MSHASRDRGSRFARALVQSASSDGPAPGAVARARARLDVGDGATVAPFAFVSALLLAAVSIATGWGPSTGPARVDSRTRVSTFDGPSECRGGIETISYPCGEAASPAGPAGTAAGGSSGADPSRGSSGG